MKHTDDVSQVWGHSQKARNFFEDLLLLITDPYSINIDKLGDGVTITTDTCNVAQKVRRLLVEYINGTVNEQD